MGAISRLLWNILAADDDQKRSQPEQVFVQRIREVAYEEALKAETERFGPRPP